MAEVKNQEFIKDSEGNMELVAEEILEVTPDLTNLQTFTSANGTKWNVSVNDSGALVIESI